MTPEKSTGTDGGVAVVLGVGSVLLVAHVIHALKADEGIRTFLLGILIPMGFAVAVLVGGVWLRQRAAEREYALRVAGGCVIGATVVATGAVLTILYQQAEGVIMSDRLFVVANGASGGAVVGFVTGVYDSRQRIARRESDRLSRQLTVLNRVLRHDVRNHANVIGGTAELLVETSPDVAEQARTIRQQTADLVELGRHAREVERLMYGDTEREVVDVASLAETCCARARRGHGNAEIDLSVPERQSVLAHPLIDSAVMNVIDNAIEHNDKRTPRIDVECTSTSGTESDTVELRIADNGPGIPDSERRILERGYETALQHSEGLGLWLVNWIVTRSGGDVAFETNEPEGSVVHLRFERADVATTPEQP